MTDLQNIAGKRHRWLPTPAQQRDNVTGFLFISPAMLIIAIFGLFPIGYAIYMSFFRWRVKRTKFFCEATYEKPFSFDGLKFWEAEFIRHPVTVIGDCFSSYHHVVGDWQGLFFTVAGFAILYGAYWIWSNRVKLVPFIPLSLILLVGGMINVLFHVAVYAGMGNAVILEGGTLEGSPIVVGLGMVVLGIGLLPGLHWLGRRYINPKQDRLLLRALIALAALALSFALIIYGWDEMTRAAEGVAMGSSKGPIFLDGMIITFYYAFISVPIQLGLGLLLAYVLYQNIKGKETFRMIFFLPYVTPAVASAAVFRIVFSPRGSSLVNQFVGVFGVDAQRWLSEPEPFMNAMFGLNLQGFLAGPSMALVAVIAFGIWTYVGYNAVIFLAGLGSIPGDLYEAARVDGANQWHLFRHITVPLLSPITFYLSVLAFIGTFKAFNHIYVMRVAQSLGTTDTASVVIFDTFRTDREFGLATAQAIVLFLIILSITQAQRDILEKRVFYG